ncbi:MAG TPA: hypothetical protein VNY07_12020 [Chthoniobacterales bacterium]|jgi:hypothetical protein|nr:hypothetical protein [Chthoniobacterales bacterium]
MNALGPPKAKRAPAKSALQKLRPRADYHALAFLANIFNAPFWFFEQPGRGRFTDLLENERRNAQ